MDPFLGVDGWVKGWVGWAVYVSHTPYHKLTHTPQPPNKRQGRRTTTRRSTGARRSTRTTSPRTRASWAGTSTRARRYVCMLDMYVYVYVCRFRKRPYTPTNLTNPHTTPHACIHHPYITGPDPRAAVHAGDVRVRLQARHLQGLQGDRFLRLHCFSRHIVLFVYVCPFFVCIYICTLVCD